MKRWFGPFPIRIRDRRRRCFDAWVPEIRPDERQASGHVPIFAVLDAEDRVHDSQ
ncbi:MAG: hypothetical protein GWP04_11985 [Gammaproteobacteria bacterium]|nr:hypothetical protein [Gammaproteobacteria bacterium]